MNPHSDVLAELGVRFMTALNHREAGRIDAALDDLRAVVLVEPRLAEPHLELARIYLDMGRLPDAEAEVREAILHLERDGRWLEELSTEVLQAIAYALLGEILKELASSDEVVFGDAKRFHALISESKAAFQRAHELDPEDTRSLVEAQELSGGGDDAELPDHPLDVRPRGAPELPES